MSPIRQQKSYFVFNKAADYRRGWWDNLICLGDSIRVDDTARPGVFWSRLLDSREKENLWHRLTMESQSLGASSVRFTFYCGDDPEVSWKGERRSLAELLHSPELTDEDRLELSRPWKTRTELDPKDILLHDLKGRYLWFRVELVPQGGQSPVIGNLMLRFPQDTWMTYLPEIYRSESAGSSFTQRYLGIFQALYSDLDQEIRNVARYWDPDVVGGDYLEWLAGWLDIEDSYLWPEDKLRALVRRGMELYRIRGTREYVVEMVKLYTGFEPWVVEHSQVEPFLTDVRRSALLKELYGDSPYRVTLILKGEALASTEAHRALLRIIENAKPAWIQVELVVLTPYLFLDQYSYLGINSRLDRYRPLELDGSAAVPFTSIGGEEERGILL